MSIQEKIDARNYEILVKQELIKAHEHQLDLIESMSRLLNNEDFKKVFMDYYQTHYLNDMLENLASSISPELEQSAKDKVKAIGCFRIFIKNLLTSKGQELDVIAHCKSYIAQLESMPITEDNEE